jgi:predicted protein tyrosine phosphatase
MQFFVYSRAHIEQTSPHDDVPHVIISITTTPQEVAMLPVCDQTRGVLRLSFYDLDQRAPGVTEDALFSPEHAQRIWDCVAEHRASIERVIVHCDAGYSRSPAIAAALSLVLEGTDEEFFRRYQPNRRVYRALINEAVARGML